MRKFTAIVTLLIASISIAINAKSNGIETEHDTQIAEWEKLAEQGICLRHAAELDYSEVVLEMKRIEPNNKQ